MKRKYYVDEVEDGFEVLLSLVAREGHVLLHSVIFDATNLYKAGKLDLLRKYHALIDIVDDVRLKEYEDKGYEKYVDALHTLVDKAIDSLNKKQNNGNKKAMFRVV
ncbi:hypothetical protein P4159_05760 [Bacillus thuringiensis]|uniref:hypothetical protein n=1 Tax=Bacillus cereus group TaxID=86661 RepID=UPI000CD9F315|nr:MULTISPECIES: hypothetical protein [Bacillus cereus group]MEC3417083.1 hypothetical protein [Bacillus cereus]MEC3596902.1 hypothetical protein [Bacillus thuringiensis]MED1574252.1 hypothetical protein [Bacillus paranthracis]MED1836175.1 hypothetical protein [Bacillus thuringiensis]MED2670238.1 hypothetical protein [Bacillus thuringiensis]